MGTVFMFILGCMLLAFITGLLSRWVIFIIGVVTLASVAFALTFAVSFWITFVLILIVALFKVAIKNSDY